MGHPQLLQPKSSLGDPRRSATMQWRSKMVARSSEGLCDEIIMAIGVGASRMSLV